MTLTYTCATCGAEAPVGTPCPNCFPPEEDVIQITDDDAAALAKAGGRVGPPRRMADEERTVVKDVRQGDAWSMGACRSCQQPGAIDRAGLCVGCGSELDPEAANILDVLPGGARIADDAMPAAEATAIVQEVAERTGAFRTAAKREFERLSQAAAALAKERTRVKEESARQLEAINRQHALVSAQAVGLRAYLSGQPVEEIPF
jgi:hypothetical protein